MKTYIPTNSMIICYGDTGDYVRKKDIEPLIIKASRLAESNLMNWQAEERLLLAKEVATMVHELLTDETNGKTLEK